VATIDDTAARAIEWLRTITALPPQPMLETRAIARADAIEALAPANVALDRFVDAWYSTDTQTAMRAVLERLGKAR